MATVTINTKDFTTIATIAEAEDYIIGSISENSDTWLAGTDDFKGRTVVSAQRIFDRLPWLGTLTVDGQDNSWPRNGITVTGFVDGVTPVGILNGLFELAMILAADPEAANTTNSGSNVKRAKGGDAEVWFFRNTEDDASILPASVHFWVKQYLDQGLGIGAIDFGTYSDEAFESVFDQEQAMLRSRGLM